MIAVIDYGAGNLRNVVKALIFLGVDVRVFTHPEGLNEADSLVLPGVGAFDDCIQALRNQELLQASLDFIAMGRPFLGICVGYQVLFEKSEEFASREEGMGILKGKVIKFSGKNGLKVPQIGWNRIKLTRPDCPLFKDVEDGSFVYFVHSYFPRPEDPACIAAETEYGETFPSVIWKDNVYATQFHPEKSQTIGLQILKNFTDLSQS